MKVLGCGVATIDQIVMLEKYPLPNEKVRSVHTETQGGGNCANTLVGLSRLGLETSIITKVGRDNAGNTIMQTLKQENVGTDYAIQEGNKSPTSIILVDKNKSTRTIIHTPGPSYDDILQINNMCLYNVDLVYLDGRYHNTAKIIIREAKERGIKIIVEAERTGLNAEELFPYANIVIISEAYFKQISPTGKVENTLDQILQMGPKIAIITLGEKGSILKTKEEIIRENAYSAKVVDTTGAGDAYNAGFIYAYMHDWKLKNAIQFASMIAAKKCEQIGARKGLPYLNQIDKLINRFQ